MSNEEGRSMDLWRGAFSDTVEEDRPNEEGMGDLEELRIIFFVYCINVNSAKNIKHSTGGV